MEGSEFRRAARWLLGVQQMFSEAIGSKCPKCAAPLDVFGDHVVCCSKNLIQRRHMALQDTLTDLVRELGLTVDKEVGTGDGTRPGDLFIPRWTADGVTVVECTVRHLNAPSRLVIDPDHVADWRHDQELEKTNKYLERCEQVGWQFVPFMMDLWGGLGPAASKFMKHYLALALGAEEETERRSIEASVWQRLSVSVMRQIGKQLTLFDTLGGPPDASLLEKAM